MIIKVTVRKRIDIAATKRAIDKQVYLDAAGGYYIGLPNGRLRELVKSEYVIYDKAEAEILTPELDTINAELARKPTTVEVYLCDVGLRSGSFIIANENITSGTVSITQAAAIYTDKGTLYDESEMDQVNVNAYISARKTIKAFWTSKTKVKGYFKFNYKID